MLPFSRNSALSGEMMMAGGGGSRTNATATGRRGGRGASIVGGGGGTIMIGGGARTTTTGATARTTTTTTTTNKQKQRQKEEEEVEDEEEASSLFISWGSSVAVNEDVRRTLESETKNVEERIDQLQASVQAEQVAERQTERDQSHTDAEMRQHRQRVQEQLEDATMQDHLRRQLAVTLRNEIQSVVASSKSTIIEEAGETGESCTDHELGRSSKREESKKKQGNHEHTMMKNHEEGRTTDRQPTHPNNAVAFLAEGRERFKDISNSIRMAKENVSELMAHAQNVREEREAVEMRICDDDLAGEVQRGQSEADVKRKELEEEHRRAGQIKASLNESRTNIGHHTSSYVENTKKLTAIKAAHGSEEDELATRIQAKGSEVKSLEDSRSALKTKLDAMTQNVETLFQQIAEFQDLRQAVKAKKEARDKILEEIRTLEERDVLQGETLAKQRERTQTTVQSRKEAQSFLEKVEAQRSENDLVQARVETTDQAEWNDLQKTKQELAIRLRKHEEGGEGSPSGEGKALEEKLKEQEARRTTIRDELQKVSGELEEKSTMRSHLERTMNESRESVQTEISQHEQSHSGFVEALKTEQDRLEQAKKDRTAKDQATRNQITTSRKELELKLEVYRSGSGYLTKAAEAEHRAKIS